MVDKCRYYDVFFYLFFYGYDIDVNNSKIITLVSLSQLSSLSDVCQKERTLNLYEVATCHALGSFFKIMYFDCFLCIYVFSQLIHQKSSHK